MTTVRKQLLRIKTVTFKEQVKTELHEMASLKMISKKRSLKACVIVDTDDTFAEDSVMSVSEAADLALALVQAQEMV